ncbi:MAG: excinuclease ABC subunit UvrA [Verrucomicrobia bacterium]|nr:excinuclease ABC subunit UvrA [Verrucomicrobiota bacterium]
MTQQPPIVLKKVRVHNLKGVDLELEHNRLVVFTGVSGSGKSSLAFDTIYVEGQRRYVESLSTYARRHLGDLPKPNAEVISGISPTIAIEQKTAGRNPRSTVGTMTGIYDFMRVLYARIGIPHCPVSKEPVRPQSAEHILRSIQEVPKGTKILVLSPFAKGKKGEFKEDFVELVRKGFTRVRLDGQIVDLSEPIQVDGKVAHDIDLVIDRMVVDPSEEKRLTEAVTQALDAGQGIMSVLLPDTGQEMLFSQFAYSPKSGLSYGPLEPSDFSFNHPGGMCPTCQGLGLIQEFDLDLVINPDLSIAEDCCSISSSYTTVRYGNIYNNLAKLYGFNINTPWKKLSDKARKVFLYGTEKKWTRMQFVHPTKKSRWSEYVQWRGVLAEARERFQKAQSDLYRSKMGELMQETTCPSCNGDRIKPYPAATQLGGKRIAEITALSIDETLLFFQNLRLTKEEKTIGEELLKEIVQRIEFLKGVGLDYLSLERTAPTLSGGEAQRVRLASQIGSGLVGATYVLDEPSIGLHPRDNIKLLETLRRLKEKGNTVIVVEHDEETIRAADMIVDVGPLAGQNGGNIIVKGSYEELIASPESITGAYLSGRLTIPIPKRRKGDGKITIQKASHHNLKSIDVQIPLKMLVAVTGVSGSGKSSLISDTLYPALSNVLLHSKLPVGKHKAIQNIDAIDKVIAIDQTPIGRTPRSNPATYIKLFDEIRDLFSQLPESVAHGYKSGRFSFNVKEGSCPHCSGMGMTKIDMDFMEDEWVECEHCHGQRFDSTTLSILYRGKNIYEVLEMTVADAHEFFSAIPQIKQKLQTLLDVGLDYIKLGQASPTLSGGEAQRIKLSKELSRPSSGNTLYILDEPTTGLHFHDIRKLIDVLQKLVDKGNTVLVIEHNTDLIKTADWIIDLGPEGGKGGGEVIAEGPPEKIAKMKTPTGVAIKAVLSPKKHQPAPELATSGAFLESITVEGASQNNLKQIDVSIPRGKITLCTGPSGSGKSSFAFETVYAEGQRRYIESLSAYSRQFVKQMPKPKVERIEGLSPAIAIEQKSHAGNPRSTIGTMTEAYDFLRVLYAHLGTAYCPDTGEKIETISKEFVLEKLLSLPEKSKLHILSPLILKRGDSFDALKEKLQKQGYLRVRLNGQYLELDQEIPFDKQRKNELFLVVDRLLVQESVRKRLFDAIDQAARLSNGTLVAATEDKDHYFNLAFAVLNTGKSYPPITPHTFSFNTEQGMCPSCQGLGFQYGANLSRHSSLMKLSASDLVFLLWKDNATKESMQLFLTFLKKEGIDGDEPLSTLSPDQLEVLFNGSKEEKSFSSNRLQFRWIGFNAVLEKFSKCIEPAIREAFLPLLDQAQCLSCKGTRLNPLARNVRIEKLSIADLCQLPIDEASRFIDAISLYKDDHIFLDETLRQLKHRLHFLNAIGLGYLSLDRSAPTLSGGESQRIRLARQLGSGLTGSLYVLDEPTIGLHPHDNARLNNALKHLCALGNTLLLVEHDPMTVQIADYLIDFGPKAGKEGGEITAQGTLEELKNNPNSLTGAYLSGRCRVPIPEKRRASSTQLKIENATLHNLKKISIDIPTGILACITGVSGSGKSTLMNDLLRPAAEKALSGRKPIDAVKTNGTSVSGLAQFDKLLVLDQNPIGHTNRADVSTYVDLLTPLRYFFADLPEAKARGLQPRHFSFNHKKGMCTSCWGLGTRHISLQFLPPVKVTCDACHGYRLNPLSLKVMTKGKHLGNILQMTVEEARPFLPPIPKVIRILDTLISVGLGYLQLGQEIATLSGGEAQRLRLSRELAKRSTGKTLYLLDEPTVGLHSDDIVKLLCIFHTLVDKGNTVLIIEHNLDIIANADYLIDMGPGSGVHGGQIVATGTPEKIAQEKQSLTGNHLQSYFKERIDKASSVTCFA